MAGKSTISITFKLDSDGKGFKELAKDAEGLKQVMTATMSEAQKLNTSAINFASIATGINAAKDSLLSLQGFMADFTKDYAYSIEAETKLATVMRQRMGATEQEVSAIKELTMAQRELGVVDDDVQMMGAQQISTFLTQKESLETLLPAMNNLIAQQKGFNATGQDAVTVGNLMGKVMQGQTSALTRVGITFDEAEEKVLKYGTEIERAAMLAQVITNNVGHMNQELAKTDISKQQQLEFKLGDIKDAMAGMIYGVQPFLTIAAQAGIALSGVTTLATGVKTLTTAVWANAKAFTVSAAKMIKTKAVALATAAAQKMAAAATAAWTAVQKVLNLVLTANPIGILITAIGGLVTALVAAYNHSEGFRSICEKVWGVVKPLGDAIMNSLVKAFDWLVKKSKEAWQWLKRILGFGGEKAEVEMDVVQTVTVKKQDQPDEMADLKNKYANYTPEKTGAVPDIKIPDQVEKQSEGLIGRLEEKINDARERLKEATSEAAIEAINKEIEAYEGQLSQYESLGKEVAEAVEQGVEDNGPVWKADAATLADISGNIQLLNDQLQTASIQEAASINQQIALWNEKADAIRDAGKEAEKVSMTSEEAMMGQWNAVKKVGNSIEGITESLKGNGNAWRSLVGIIDGFISLYEGIKTIVSIVETLTGVTIAHTAAKGAEAGAEATASAVRATGAATDAAASTAVITANKLETASWRELAASKYMAAHAGIPFAGFGIAAGFTSAMMATVAAAGVPMLAEGGIATGPTLAMVGEYSGASAGNPEIIAPLDKLRGLLSEPASVDFGKVEFEIKGRNLVGILNRENSINRRG